MLPLQESSKVQHGGIIDVESEEELDKMLAEDPHSLTVLLASLTWCRPCKTLAKPLQACPMSQSKSTYRACSCSASTLLGFFCMRS